MEGCGIVLFWCESVGYFVYRLDLFVPDGCIGLGRDRRILQTYGTFSRSLECGTVCCRWD